MQMSAAQINGKESIVEDNNKTFEWSVRVPIFRNNLILKQLGVAIGIPFGLLIVFFAAAGIKTQSLDWLYATGMVLGFLFAGFLFVLLIFRGTYDVRFVADKKRCSLRKYGKAGKKSKIAELNNRHSRVGFKEPDSGGRRHACRRADKNLPEME
jgi:hypothetical protein